MINIVVPMAGLGSRFAAAGEALPKPLIEVLPGRPMIDYVIDFLSLDEPHRFIFVCLADHDRRFGLGAALRARVPNCQIVLADTLTRGPAATALLAAPMVNGDSELLIAYCDSFLTIELADFLAHNRGRGSSGGVMVYPSSSPLESYAVLDAAGNVLQTAEKQVLSAHATAGFYYFKRWSDYAGAANAMIAAGNAVGSEYFVCPAYNELIKQGKSVSAFPIERDQRIEMGTPEDLARSRDWLLQCKSRAPRMNAA